MSPRTLKQLGTCLLVAATALFTNAVHSRPSLEQLNPLEKELLQELTTLCERSVNNPALFPWGSQNPIDNLGCNVADHWGTLSDPKVALQKAWGTHGFALSGSKLNRLITEAFGHYPSKKEQLSERISLAERGMPMAINSLEGLLARSQIDINKSELERALALGYGDDFGPIYKETLQIIQGTKNLNELAKAAHLMMINMSKVSPMTSSIHWELSDAILSIFAPPMQTADMVHELLQLTWQEQLALFSFLSSFPTKTQEQPHDELIKGALRAVLWPNYRTNERHSYDNSGLSDFEYLNLTGYLMRMQALEDMYDGVPPYLLPSFIIPQVMKLRSEGYGLERFDFAFPRASDLLTTITLLPIESEFRLLPVPQSENENIQSFIIGWESILLSKSQFGDLNYSMLSNHPISTIEQAAIQALTLYPQLTRIAIELDRVFIEGASAGLPLSEIDFDSVLQRELEDPTELCNSQESLSCLKLWGTLNNLALDQIVFIDDRGGCSINKKHISFLKSAASNFVYPNAARNQCTLGAYFSALGLEDGPSYIANNFWINFSYPTPIGGVEWLESRWLLQDRLGILGGWLVERSAPQNLPLPSLLVGLDEFADPIGFSLIDKLSQLPMPVESPYIQSEGLAWPRPPRFERYAEIQSTKGNLDIAFASRLAEVKYSKTLVGRYPYSSVSELIFLSQQIGMSTAQIRSVLASTEIDQLSRPTKDGSVWDPIIDYFEGFTKMVTAEEVFSAASTINPSSSIEDFSYWTGNFYSLKPAEWLEMCENQHVRSLVLGGEEYEQWNAVGNLPNFAPSQLFSQANVFAICQLADVYALPSENRKAVANEVYETLLKFSILPGLARNANISDPRWLPTIGSLVSLGALADRKFGVIAGLFALNEMYLNLTRTFVDYDSVGIRLLQGDIERTISIAVYALEEMKYENQDEISRTIDLALTLYLSAKHPLISDKVRSRLLQPDPSKTFNPGLLDPASKAFEAALSTSRKSLSSANSITEILEAKRVFLGRRPFQIVYSSRAMDEVENLKSSNIQFISLASSGTLITAIGLGNIDRQFKLATSLVSQSVDQLKFEIFDNDVLSRTTHKKLCRSLSEFHDQLDEQFRFNVTKPIFVVPSVETFPVPTEILLGFACKSPNRSPPLILVNDAIGALEAYNKLGDTKLPQHLIAQGNPTVGKDSGFDTLLADFRGQAISDIEDFAPLPDAEIEISNAAKSFSEATTLLATEASISHALELTESTNDAMLILATHGVGIQPNIGAYQPGLLTVDDGSLGLFTSTNLYQYSLDEAIVMLSACSTAAGFVKIPSLLFTGFPKSFADIGAKSIISSLWPVKSVASRRFTETFVKTWQRTQDFYNALTAAKKSSDIEDTFPFVVIYP